LVQLSLGSHDNHDSEENVSKHDDEQEEAQDDEEQEQQHGMTPDKYAAFASLFQGHVVDSTYQVGYRVGRHDHLYPNTSLSEWKDAEDEEEEEDDKTVNLGTCPNCGGVGLEGTKCEDCEDMAMYYIGELEDGDEETIQSLERAGHPSGICPECASIRTTSASCVQRAESEEGIRFD